MWFLTHLFVALYFVCIIWLSSINDHPFIASDKWTQKYVDCIVLRVAALPVFIIPYLVCRNAGIWAILGKERLFLKFVLPVFAKMRFSYDMVPSSTYSHFRVTVSSMDGFSIWQRKRRIRSIQMYATKMIRNITTKLNPRSVRFSVTSYSF